MGHHGKKTRALQVQVGIDADDGVAAYLHPAVGILQVELLQGGLVGRGVVRGEIPDIGTQLYSQSTVELPVFCQVTSLSRWKMPKRKFCVSVADSTWMLPLCCSGSAFGPR